MKRAVRIREWYSRGRRVGEQVELALLLGERLDDPHAGDGLVDHAGDGARQRWSFQLAGNERLRKRLREPREQRHEHDHHHGEQRRQERHDHQRAASRVRLAIDIGSCWRNTWINVRSAVARDITSPVRSWSRRCRVEVLHVVVHGDLQVALHVDGGPPAEAAAAVVGDEADHADGDQQGDPRGERALIGEHGVVEDHALHERAEGEEHLRHHGQGDRGEHAPAVAPEDRSEAAHPPDLFGRRGGGSHHVSSYRGDLDLVTLRSRYRERG